MCIYSGGRFVRCRSSEAPKLRCHYIRTVYVRMAEGTNGVVVLVLFRLYSESSSVIATVVNVVALGMAYPRLLVLPLV